eukprot:184576-Hanusia_phi.AAC.1
MAETGVAMRGIRIGSMVAVLCLVYAILQLSDSEPSGLSMKLRSHDVEAIGSRHSAVPHPSSSPHAPVSPVHTHLKARAAHANSRKLSAKQLKEQREEEEIWKTEQAMKAQLNQETNERQGKLWHQTVAVVHAHDPNAKLIAKLEPKDGVVKSKGPAEEEGKQTSRGRAEKGVSSSTQNLLKDQLDKSLKSKMANSFSSIQTSEQQKLSKTTRDSKLAETAEAHAKMARSDIAKMLKNQLDSSVKEEISRAKQLSSFNSNSQLEARLKAELDSKAKEQQKKMLEQSSKPSMYHARKKLSGSVERAERIRDQLTRKMKEEDAIRSQLNQATKEKEKELWKDQTEGKKPAAEEVSDVFSPT